jgi:hypothetical protein
MSSTPDSGIEIPTDGLRSVILSALVALAKKDDAVTPFEAPLKVSLKSQGSGTGLWFLLMRHGICDLYTSSVLGYSKYEPEPDLAILVNLDEKLNTGSAIKLIERLQRALPEAGIQIAREKNYVRSEFSSPDTLSADDAVPCHLWIKFERESLLRALEATQDPDFRVPYMELKRRVDLFNLAELAGQKDDDFDAAAYFITSLVNAGAINKPGFLSTLSQRTDGRFFPTSDLETLFSIASPIISNPDASRTVIGENLSSEIIEYLNSIGLTSLSFMNRGRDSIVFRSLTNDEGHRHIVAISPMSTERNPQDFPAHSPFHLPTYVEPFHGRVQVKITPELSVSGPDGRSDAWGEMLAILKKYGLNTKEIRDDNVGYYTYADHAGKIQCVPMILDWGAGRCDFKKLSDEYKSGMHSELKPWFDAQEHIRSHGIRIPERSNMLEPIIHARPSAAAPL